MYSVHSMRIPNLRLLMKIVRPEAWSEALAPGFWFSIDGVHCRANEIIHPTLAKDTKLYSHKFNQAGFAYELAISLTENALVWMNGPFKASKHDVTIFRYEGLKNLMAPSQKKGIADMGYRGERGLLCTASSLDSAKLRTFKVSIHFKQWMCRWCSLPFFSQVCMSIILFKQSRARARHETFNSRIKNFANTSLRMDLHFLISKLELYKN
jgi:hypothetical protein